MRAAWQAALAVVQAPIVILAPSGSGSSVTAAARTLGDRRRLRLAAGGVSMLCHAIVRAISSVMSAHAAGPTISVVTVEASDRTSARLCCWYARCPLNPECVIYAGRPSEDLVCGPMMPSASMCACRCQLRTASRVAGP